MPAVQVQAQLFLRYLPLLYVVFTKDTLQQEVNLPEEHVDRRWTAS